MTIAINKDKLLFGLSALLFVLTAAFAALTGFYFLIGLPFALLFFYAGWKWSISLFFFLLFSLPLSFEYRFASGFGTDFPDELMMVFISFIFLARWFYSPDLITAKTLQHPLLILLMISLAWMIVTVCFSTDSFISMKYLLAKSWYIGAFVIAPLIILKNKQRVAMAACMLAGGILLVTIITLFRHYQTGFSFAGINDAVSPFFRNHVNYSAMLVCMVPVLVAFFSLTKNRDTRWIIGVLIAIALTALFFSYARGAWLALLAGTAAGWLLKRKWLFAAYIAALLIIIASLFWVKANDRYLLYAHDYKTTIFHKDFGEHLVATYKLKDVSTAERFYRWIAGVRMIKDNWLTGYGPNTFYDNYAGYTVPAYKTWVSDNDDHSTVHNYFLLTAIEQGLPGLLFLLLLMGALLWYAQHLYHRVNDHFYKTAAITAGVVLSMILTLNFLSDLIETDKIGSLFFLCLSLLVSIDINSRKLQDQF